MIQLPHINRFIAVNPRHAQAHNNLGITYEKKGMAEKAHSEYEKAVSADPNLAPALYNLGKSYLTRALMIRRLIIYTRQGCFFIRAKIKNGPKNRMIC